MIGSSHLEKLAENTPLVTKIEFQQWSPGLLRMVPNLSIVGPHGRFPIRLEIIVKETLPVFPPQAVYEASDPVEMLQDPMQPVFPRLQQCFRTRIVP